MQTWKTEVLDRILRNGDGMCINSYLKDNFPVITDLEKQFCVDGNLFQVNVGDSYIVVLFTMLVQENNSIQLNKP